MMLPMPKSGAYFVSLDLGVSKPVARLASKHGSSQRTFWIKCCRRLSHKTYLGRARNRISTVRHADRIRRWLRVVLTLSSHINEPSAVGPSPTAMPLLWRSPPLVSEWKVSSAPGSISNPHQGHLCPVARKGAACGFTDGPKCCTRSRKSIWGNQDQMDDSSGKTGETGKDFCRMKA